MNQNCKRQIVALLVATLFCGTAAQATVDVFTAAGTSQWQCPAGVTTVTVECWGGGGAGGSARASSGTASTSTSGGGGAGGAYVMKTNITVVPGNFYSLNVGTNGVADAAASITDGDHSDGGDSWFNDTSTVLAKGGSGGISKNAARPVGGAGGTCPSGSIGDTINLGGNGAAGNGALGVTAGGGGGGSGGTLGAGNNGGSPNVQSGATAVSGGGPGGAGRQSASSGGAGNAPASGSGGGGGGAISFSMTGQQGGAGAVGKVSISYTIPGTSYTWVATSGSADWTSPSSWSPNRNSLANNDVLLFNQGGNSTAINVPTETDGKLQVSGNTIINLQASSASTLTLGATAADSLTVASGSQLNDNGTSALLIALPLGAKGSINGSMTFSNAADMLTAVDASGITFNSGATFTQNCSGNVFGSGTANSIVFASGSTFIQFTGGNPFQKTQPVSIVTFQTGSLFSARGNTAPSTSGRTYADFECNETNVTVSVTGGSALTMSNLTVVQNAFTISMGGGLNLNGNASVASGATLNLNNTVATATGKTVIVNGTLGGTATISGNAAFIISSTGTLAPGSSSSIGTLTLATAPTLSGATMMKIDRDQTPNADKIVLSNGTLNYGGTLVITNSGAALQTGDTFTLFNANAYNGSFSVSPANPDNNSNLAWDTSLLASSGVITVVAASTPSPRINSISLSGTTLAVVATNGSAGGTWTLLQSTDVALPPAQWQTNRTGTFDGSGNLSTNILNVATNDEMFYILKQ